MPSCIIGGKEELANAKTLVSNDKKVAGKVKARKKRIGK